MRGPIRAVILSRAIAAGCFLLAGGCATGVNTDAVHVDENETCMFCSAMSPRQFRSALTALQKTQDLRADIFVGGGADLYPVAIPLRAVEDGAKCTVSDSGTVAKLVALMSALKYSQGDLTGIRPVLEIRFYRAGHASERPVLEAFFDLGFGKGAFKEGAVMMAVVNGRFVLVDYKHLGMLEDFAAELTVPPENKVCEASENR
jgi:hypothetical protein